MFLRLKSISLIFLTVLLCAVFAVAQDDKQPAQEDKKQEKQAKQEKPKKNEKQKAFDIKSATAEQIAETMMFVYGGLGGRANLNQIRRTTVESGKSIITNPDGTTDQLSYVRRVVRGENLEKEKIRLDQEFPNARYSLIQFDGKTFGILNETVFTPRDEAVKSFESYFWHGLDAMLRYKENGSTPAIGGREKIMGVEYIQLDVTDKQNRKTRFFVSEKSLRVLALEYSDNGVKYHRRFYDYRDAQGTLVPYRTTLTANGKQVEETTISTITFGQKIEDEIFKAE